MNTFRSEEVKVWSKQEISSIGPPLHYIGVTSPTPFPSIDWAQVNRNVKTKSIKSRNPECRSLPPYNIGVSSPTPAPPPVPPSCCPEPPCHRCWWLRLTANYTATTAIDHISFSLCLAMKISSFLHCYGILVAIISVLFHSDWIVFICVVNVSIALLFALFYLIHQPEKKNFQHSNAVKVYANVDLRLFDAEMGCIAAVHR